MSASRSPATPVDVCLSDRGDDILLGQAFFPTARGQVTTAFRYADDYLTRKGAWPVEPGLPLFAGPQAVADGRNPLSAVPRRAAHPESVHVMEATPPDSKDLRRALARLGRDDSMDAALHLALPVGDVPGFSVRPTDLGWSWRGVSILPGVPSQSAALLACLGWRTGDVFLDLSADPADWLKPVRSGTAWYVFGLDCLLGLPVLRVPATASRPDVERAGKDMAAGRLRLGSRLMGGVLRESAGCWEVTSAVSGRTGLDASHALALALGGVLVDLPGSVGVRLPSGQLLAVPADCDGEALALRPFRCLPGIAQEPVPAGFWPAGVTESGAHVVEHAVSRVRAILL